MVLTPLFQLGIPSKGSCLGALPSLYWLTGFFYAGVCEAPSGHRSGERALSGLGRWIIQVEAGRKETQQEPLFSEEE